MNEGVREVWDNERLPEGCSFLISTMSGRKVGLALLEDGRRVRFELHDSGLSCAVYPPVRPDEDPGHGMYQLKKYGEDGAPIEKAVLTPRGKKNKKRLADLLKRGGHRVTAGDTDSVRATILAVFEADLARRRKEAKEVLTRLSKDGVDVVALASEVVVSEVMRS